MPITRRWDPCLWRDGYGTWHMLCLAAHYF